MLLSSLNKSARFGQRLFYVAVAWLILLGINLGHAAEWAVNGHLDQSLGYDDNVRMQKPADAQGSFKYKILPTIKFQHKTDVSEINGYASYGTQIFTDVPRLNQDIQNYGANGLYKTERIDWGLVFNYSETPTRNTALDDSGNFSRISSKHSWSVAPSMSYKLSEIDSIIVTPAYKETSFQNTVADTSGSATPNDPIFSFRDSTTKSINVAWARNWNEFYNSSVSFSYSNFESKQSTGAAGDTITTPSTFNSTGINFSNNYILSEKLTIFGSIGGRYTDSTYVPDVATGLSVNSSSFGFLTNAGINYTGETYKSGLTVSRSLVPSNSGFLQELTGVNLHFTYRIDERLSTSLNTYYQQSTFVNNVSSIERDNFLIEPSVNWMVAQDWKLMGSYRYRTQDINKSANPAANTSNDSNLFMLSINYTWPGLSLSR